ncbi:MAG: hypothetical protein M1404_04085 [Acidobacteria bacterium]|nr:hypothetical protein [Acidobacteriota bacterium]
MSENNFENEHEPEIENAPIDSLRSTRPLWVAAVVVLCLAAVAVGFIVDQHKIASRLSARNQELTTSLTQTQGQLNALGTELNTMKTEEAAREQAAKEKAAREEAARERAALAARRAAAIEHARYRRLHSAVKKDDPRWKQVEAELAAHQKAIDSTQQDIQKTQSEFQSSLSSTRDELSGSIAKTHAELVELEKRGERNYYEFDLYKTKRFQRVGPIGVSLRKTNKKHQFCNLHLLVDDRELTKKHVNLYEPVMFYTDQSGQPLEIVINRISKNHMHGYVSVPKYGTGQTSAANASSSSNQVASATPATATDSLEHRPSAVP